MPELGRWLNRDPIGEKGGRNIYVLLGNQQINDTDYLGYLGYKSWTFCSAVEQVRSTYREWMPQYPFAAKLMRHWLEENITALIGQNPIPDYTPDSNDIEEVKSHGIKKIKSTIFSVLFNANPQFPSSYSTTNSKKIRWDYFHSNYDPNMFRAYGGAELTFSSANITYELYSPQQPEVLWFEGSFKISLYDMYRWPHWLGAMADTTYNAARFLEINYNFKHFEHRMTFYYIF